MEGSYNHQDIRYQHSSEQIHVLKIRNVVDLNLSAMSSALNFRRNSFQI